MKKRQRGPQKAQKAHKAQKECLLANWSSETRSHFVLYVLFVPSVALFVAKELQPLP
jgi:hypothetical protein